MSVEPLVARYEVKYFQCPMCETVLRLACLSEYPQQPEGYVAKIVAA
jgi:hypothetical protein